MEREAEGEAEGETEGEAEANLETEMEEEGLATEGGADMMEEDADLMAETVGTETAEAATVAEVEKPPLGAAQVVMREYAGIGTGFTVTVRITKVSLDQLGGMQATASATCTAPESATHHIKSERWLAKKEKQKKQAAN